MVIEAVLLARLGSLVLADTVAVLVIVFFFAITVTMTWVVLEAPLATEPRLQLIVPLAPGTGVMQLPWLG